MQPTRPTAHARLHEWGGFLMDARASRNRADAAVGGDGGKKTGSVFNAKRPATGLRTIGGGGAMDATDASDGPRPTMKD